MRGLPQRTSPAYRRATLGLKACPFCGAVNARDNVECFVCRWHGKFEQDPELVSAALTELLGRCAELADAMDEEPPCPVLLMRARLWLAALRNRF